jgi:hypothetical protein
VSDDTLVVGHVDGTEQPNQQTSPSASAGKGSWHRRTHRRRPDDPVRLPLGRLPPLAEVLDQQVKGAWEQTHNVGAR